MMSVNGERKFKPLASFFPCRYRNLCTTVANLFHLRHAQDLTVVQKKKEEDKARKRDFFCSTPKA